MFNQYAKYYDLINSNKNYKKEVDFIWLWAGKPETILDLGCGTASYWKYFPKDIRLVGIEKSEDMIKFSKYKNRILVSDIMDGLNINKNFDCIVSLFDVINYLPNQNWWRKLPLKKGGYFIFDIWNLNKVNKEGFKTTKKGNRIIKAIRNKNKVVLDITLPDCKETHIMYLYSDKDINKFCGKYFKIVDKKETDTWQTWYKLERVK